MSAMKCFLLSCCSVFLALSAAQAADFFVAPGGNDASPGALEERSSTPARTPEEARALRPEDYLTPASLLRLQENLARYMPKIQSGMHNLPDGEVVLANYHEVRIRHAQHLLERTSKSCADIAYDVGFADQSYFIKHFKRHTGVTPFRYRHRYTLAQRRPSS